MKKENIDFKLISKYYEVLFYWSFINFKREMQLKDFLESKGFLVSFSNLKLDAIFKVDLIAKNETQQLYIQLKNKFVNFSASERQKLIHFANCRNSIPLLVTKQKNTYSFWNLITDEEFNF